MKRIEDRQARVEIDSLRKTRAIRRRLRKDPYLDLRPYATEIVAWARCSGASKSIVQELVNRSFGISVSRDRLYRLVISELGMWPNGRNGKSNGGKHA